MARLSEILSKIEDNVSVQFLNNSLVRVYDKKGTKDTEVTFATVENNASGISSGSGKTALIVWVEAEEYNSAVLEINRNK